MTELAMGGDLHGIPTAAQLIEAVREFLERDVMAATDGRVNFHTRVAVNALAVVERELTLGPAQREEAAARLAELGFADEAALAAAIRSGSVDERWDEVKATVWQLVRDRLAVANPAYAGSE